ncbi:MAG: metallophosphoesterase [Pseudomonadota bacterium]
MSARGNSRCHHAGSTTAAVLATLLLSGAACAGDESPAWRWQNVARVIAFGDVHGDYDALRTLLAFAEIIDGDDHWIGGDTHLVSLGDLLDRGPDSRRVMDLLMRLEGEAGAAGGHVHVLIGNHEQMNLTGDLRYVAKEEYAAFAGPEDEALREAALKRTRGAKHDEAVIRKRPAGFFAHRAAFSPRGAYGRWLLEKPIIAVINDTAFVHGGLYPQAAAIPAKQWVPALNATLREATELRAEKSLQRADLLDQNVVDLGTPKGLASLPPSAKSLRPNLQRVASAELFGATGPLWYRGNAACHPALEALPLQRALAQLGAARVAVGHTPQADHRIRSRLNGRVLLLDTGMLKRYYGGQPRALLLVQGEAPRVLSPDGQQQTVVADAPAVLGGQDAERLDQLFERGILREANGPGGATLTLDGAQAKVEVLDLGNRARRRVLAAHRIDRQLGLGFVPLVAERGEGRDGVVLRLNEGEWLTEPARKQAKRIVPNYCGAGHPFALIRLFDALIGHQRRAQEIAYSVPGYAIRLTGHDDAFAASSSNEVAAPDMPADVAIALLERVDETFQEEVLSILLSRPQLRALEARRSALLGHYRRR